MPGEDRKFNRRRIVAFPPTCNRERANADSHVYAPEGGSSVSVASVAVGSLGGVAVEVGVTIGVGEGSRVNVEVGAENGVEVEVRDADSVTVCVADGSAGGVEVAAPDVGEGDSGGRSVGGELVEVWSAVEV